MLRLLPLVQPRELAQHFYGSASLPSTCTWPPRTSQSTISQLRDSESKAPTLEELTHSSHRGWRQASGQSPMLPCAPRPHEAPDFQLPPAGHQTSIKVSCCMMRASYQEICRISLDGRLLAEMTSLRTTCAGTWQALRAATR